MREFLKKESGYGTLKNSFGTYRLVHTTRSKATKRFRRLLEMIELLHQVLI